MRESGCEVKIDAFSSVAEDSPEPSSCGFDLWQSPEGVRWRERFLHAKALTVHVLKDSRQARVHCLLRRLPAGLCFASAYPYGFIDGDVVLFWSSLRAVRRALIRRGIVLLEISFTGDCLGQLPTDPVHARGARIADSSTDVRHVLDLELAARGAGDLDRHFDPRIRWAIRKAARSCVVRNGTAADVALLQSIYARTMRAKQAPVNYGAERWEGMLTDLQATGRCAIYVAQVDGRPIGFAAAADGAVSRHLIQLAVPPEAHATRAGELLVATAMRGALDLGKRYFDFMASPASDVGLIAFKSKWGATQEPIRHVAIPGVPMMSKLVNFGRWLNRTGARLRAK